MGVPTPAKVDGEFLLHDLFQEAVLRSILSLLCSELAIGRFRF